MASENESGNRPPFVRVHLWQIQAVRDLLLVAAIVMIFWSGYALRAVTVPLLVALLLAYLFEPVIAWLGAKYGISRHRAVVSVLVLACAMVIGSSLLAIPLVVGQTAQLVRDVTSGAFRSRIERLEQYVPEDYRDSFRSAIEVLPAGFAAESALEGEESEVDQDPVPPPDGADAMENGEISRAEIESIVNARVAEILAQGPKPSSGADLMALARGSSQALLGFLSATIEFGLLAFLIPFYFYFFSLWYPKFVTFGRSMLPRAQRDRWLDLLDKMDRVVAGFVRGRIVIAILMGIGFAVGWMICGVPYAIPVGLVVGVFCVVPYLGLVGVPVAVGLLFYREFALPAEERYAWWAIILWPTLVFTIIQTIEGYVLTPMIAGKATDLDPVTILVVVLAGGSVLGVYGMLLAIPAAACGKILLRESLMPRIRAWLAGNTEDPLPLGR